MVNKVILVGRLGGDPEVRVTAGGTSVASFTLATNERRKDGDTWTDATEWHRVACFNQNSKFAGEYLFRGHLVYVEGKIRTRKWQDKDGNDRYTTEILADVVRALSAPATRDTSSSTSSNGGGADDEIPF